MTNQRSPITISVIEGIAAGVAGVGTWLFQRSVLWWSVPFGAYVGPTDANPGLGATTYERLWQLHGSQLLLQFGLLFAFFAMMAAIFLVRAIRKDVQRFSVIGHLALAWPLAGNCLVIPYGLLSGYFWPIGLLVAVLATIGLVATRNRKYGDLLAIPLNLAWLYLVSIYAARLWGIYGD